MIISKLPQVKQSLEQAADRTQGLVQTTTVRQNHEESN